jgi:uncharacterized protein (DUF1778 family)
MARKTHTSTAVKSRYNAKAYDRIVLTLKKGDAAMLAEYASSKGESRNAFILRAIDETIKRDKEKGDE